MKYSNIFYVVNPIITIVKICVNYNVKKIFFSLNTKFTQKITINCLHLNYEKKNVHE